MSHHNHNTVSSDGNTKKSGRKLHKDWRIWLMVILMLVSMVIYVLSLDESIMPRLFGH